MIITNQGILPSSALHTDLLNPERAVYEVIRIMDGTAIFLEDHFYRLERSFQIQGIQIPMNFSVFENQTAELVRINQKAEGNLKFVYVGNGHQYEWAFFFIPHSYPSDDDYKFGVKVDLLQAERNNPNAKVIQQSVRDSANQKIAENKIYEVLLTDNEGIITEGSRSNVFFVKDDTFYTAPESKILVGITRKKVIKCLDQLHLQVIETGIHSNEISDFDALFLTGTSPKVLPIQSVGKLYFSTTNPFVKKLMSSYDQMIVDYLQSKKFRK